MMMRKPALSDLGVGFGVGAFSGLLGVGGGILLVPFLVLVRSFNQKRAQATSLVMVACAALFGALTYALDGQVMWLPALLLLAGGFLGSLVGSHLVVRSPNHVLQGAFAVLMVVVAVYLLIGAPDASDADVVEISIAVAAGYAMAGLVMGILSALFGIGGGIVLIPILVGLFGYSQQLAAGTSLAVMCVVALVGAVRLTSPGLTDWRSGLTFGIASIPGALVGAAIALALPGNYLRGIFAVVMAGLGVRMLMQSVRTARDSAN